MKLIPKMIRDHHPIPSPSMFHQQLHCDLLRNHKFERKTNYEITGVAAKHTQNNTSTHFIAIHKQEQTDTHI